MLAKSMLACFEPSCKGVSAGAALQHSATHQLVIATRWHMHVCYMGVHRRSEGVSPPLGRPPRNRQNHFESCVRARGGMPGGNGAKKWSGPFPFSHLGLSLFPCEIYPFSLVRYMKSSEIKWNEMKSNEIKLNQVTSSEIKWNQMESSGIKWNQVKTNEIKRNQMTSN